ncbi:Trp operon repressor [Francisella halioticida]|uniref:Trp operon repressor n=1 Tax=Francisella halioticida TaxID=549298 RepID=A0ABM6M2F4_9GAMM|nr:trp operon repressor [Francisella halioticida]ASG68957.1 Trp operon repressor [Francisella halioticida]BCD92250.1 Trp operon repressor [Francisella halioticida]
MASSKNGWNQLIDILAKTTDSNDISALCDFLFTKEEKEQVNNRVLLTKQLVNKTKSQREISKNLGISICTVTRCSNALKECSIKIKEIFGK